MLSVVRLNAVMLKVVMMSAVMLNVVMLSDITLIAVMLSVVAPILKVQAAGVLPAFNVYFLRTGLYYKTFFWFHKSLLTLSTYTIPFRKYHQSQIL